MGKSFSISDVRTIMNKSSNIRNMSVIAHVDHGKSTLTDSLISMAGLIARAKQGEARFMDTRKDEQERSITIKSTSVSLLYEFPFISTPETPSSHFLINLIDSPGHVDFSSEVTTALRTTDGALVVVDCMEGVCTQTETVLRQALRERVKPVLFLNKIDRVLSELDLNPEQIYSVFRKVIENANVIISTFKDASVEKEMGKLEVTPENGTVGFGSGLQAWAFTLEYFYRRNYNQDPAKAKQAAKMLWGERFYNATTKKWSKKSSDGVRGFNHFVMGPLKEFFEVWREEKPTPEQLKKRDELIKKYNIKIPTEFSTMKKQKQKVKALFYSWIPAGEPMLEMIVNHLPDPKTAQAYRSPCVYIPNHEIPIEELEEEDQENRKAILSSESYKGIISCNSDGPSMVFISKMVPTSEPGRFYAFGRIFSGTINTGDEVYIIGGEGSGKKAIKTKVLKVCLMMGRFVETLSSCPAGNMIGLTGVDKYILKTATITNMPEVKPFKSMQFSVSPVVRNAVSVKKGSDLPKLLEGLNRLSKSDPLLKIISDKKTGEHILACAGELHLEICLKDLREEYCKGVEIVVSKPVVTYCESCEEESQNPSIICAKSANKHNRLFVQAQPISDELVQDIIEGKVSMDQDPKERSRYLQNKHNWAKGVGRKIWSLGHPEFALCNVLVDSTKSIQNLSEVKESIVSAFADYTSRSSLTGESMRGVRFDLVDAQLHVDSTHRGSNQMISCAWRAFAGSHLAASPIILEPVYSVEIQVPDSQQDNALKVLNQAKGLHTNTLIDPNSPIVKLYAELPVANSFGFAAKLRAGTAGKAFPTLSMDKWQKVDGKVFTNPDSKVKDVINEIRERKGLNKELPTVKQFHDNL